LRRRIFGQRKLGELEMKIGLVGFYGWGNFGDELFIRAHEEFLSDLGTIEPINDLQIKPYFSKPIEEVVNQYDMFVIGGGDLVIPWSISELYWKEEYLKKPVHVIGVGVPTWGGFKKDIVKKYQKFLQSDSIKTLIARDQESADWINKHIQPKVKAKFYPDLVCGMTLPEPPQSSKKILGVTLRRRRGGVDDLSQVRKLCEHAKKLDYSIRLICLANLETGKLDAEVIQNFALEDEEVIITEDLDEMCTAIGQCSAYASMKFHGTIVAAMYGVPSLILSATDKNNNFARMIARPDTITSIADQHLFHRLAYEPVPIHPMVISWLKERACAGYEALRNSIIYHSKE